MRHAAFLLCCVASCYCEVEISERARNFSIELLYHTRSESDGHVVVSPFAVWTLMAGLMVGATHESFEELARVTFSGKRTSNHLAMYQNLTSTVLSPNSPDVSLSSDYYLFLDDNFVVYPEFLKTMKRDFNASVHVLDFDSPNAIEATNALIDMTGANVKNVLRSNDFEHSVMLLTNVVTFKGVWTTPFDRAATKLATFYCENHSAFGIVHMMTQNAHLRFSIVQSLKSHVLELPYGTDGRYCMLFILPHPSGKVVDLYKDLSNISLKDVFRQLEEDEQTYGRRKVELQIPRFRISTSVVLNQPLHNMGLNQIFDTDSASFSKVSRDDIFVSEIVHKVDIEVTEEGTAASASTSANFYNKIVGSTKFRLNRPFLYFVVERSTTTVIFGGIYSKPTKAL